MRASPSVGRRNCRGCRGRQAEARHEAPDGECILKVGSEGDRADIGTGLQNHSEVEALAPARAGVSCFNGHGGLRGLIQKFRQKAIAFGAKYERTVPEFDELDPFLAHKFVKGRSADVEAGTEIVDRVGDWCGLLMHLHSCGHRRLITTDIDRHKQL